MNLKVPYRFKAKQKSDRNLNFFKQMPLSHGIFDSVSKAAKNAWNFLLK